MFANYEDRLANGDVDIRELVVSKRITREPRDYQKAGVTAIAAQQLFGSGVKLRPGQNIEYIITNTEAQSPMIAFGLTLCGKVGSDTTARYTPQCCAKLLSRLCFPFQSVGHPFF